MARRRVISRAVAAAGTFATLAGSLVVPAGSAAASGGSLPTLTLAMSRNAITVGGDRVSGAVNVVTTVKGERSDSPTIVRLNPGTTPAQLLHAIKHLNESKPLDAVDPYGSIVYDGDATAAAGSSAEIVLEPGTYVALNNGRGFTPFTVTASAEPAPLPAPGATVTAIDFGFTGASTLHDGELVRFENDGYLIHMAIYARVKNVAAARTVEKLTVAGKMHQAARYILRTGQFFGPLSHGAIQQQRITQPPGVYVIVCVMPTQDGRSHVQLGMVKTLRIVR